MSARTLKISVVVGHPRHTRLLQVYEPLLQFGNVDIHLIDDERILKEARSACRLVIYPHLNDMPGYMRGLEEQLQESDLIVAAETSSLAAFQAVRVARKDNIPSLILCDEVRPLFYAGYPNIRAIQSDVIEHATAFATSSQLARASLQIEGVADERLHAARHPIDLERFKVSDAGRAKFRKYVGLNPQDFVITIQERLTPASRVMEVIQAVRLCATLKPMLAPRLRLLVVGDGDQAKELKYAAFDHGLGKQVMFLHQHCEPFLHDLYAASDMVVHMRHNSPDLHEAYPLHILEAGACGALPIVSAHTVAAEALGKSAVVLQDDSFQNLALQIGDLGLNADAYLRKREAVVKHLQAEFTVAATSKHLEAAVKPLLAIAENGGPKQLDFASEVMRYEDLIRAGRADDTVVMLEEAILRHTLPTSRSELMRLKGEALTRCGRAEDAIQAYTESLQLNDTNAHSYRALGYLSLQSHAHEEAVTFFKKALANDPDDASSLIGVGMVYRRLGLPDESLHWFETAVQKSQSEGRAIGGFVQVCLECSDPNRALAAVERAIDTRGEHSSLMVAKGQLLIKVGRTTEGNDLLQKSLGFAG